VIAILHDLLRRVRRWLRTSPTLSAIKNWL
jgi:hypothetical protein